LKVALYNFYLSLVELLFTAGRLPCHLNNELFNICIKIQLQKVAFHFKNLSLGVQNNVTCNYIFFLKNAKANCKFYKECPVFVFAWNQKKERERS